MFEHKYKIGDIVVHKLTGDKLIVILLLHHELIRKYYRVRKSDYTVHDCIEQELEEVKNG